MDDGSGGRTLEISRTFEGPRVKVVHQESKSKSATIGDARGLDGLKVKDIPEMEVKDGKVSFGKTPTLVVIRKKISKIRKPYDTFAPAQACEYVRQYFEGRIRSGEALGPDSACAIEPRDGILIGDEAH